MQLALQGTTPYSAAGREGGKQEVGDLLQLQGVLPDCVCPNGTLRNGRLTFDGVE